MAIIVPQTFADVVNKRLGVKLRAGRLATDYTEMVEDITTCGDTVHFPMIKRITDAGIVTKGTPLVPDEVDMEDATAAIKQVAKAVRIYRKDNTQVKDELKNKLAMQVADALAKSVDADIVGQILTATYVDDTVSNLTAAVVDEAFDVFGDDVDNDTFAGILINSKLRKAFMAMDAFTSVMKTNATYGNGIVQDGIIGYWNGTIPVYVSDNGTYDDTNHKALLAIVKNDALGVVWQQEPTIEEEREAKLLADDIVASEMYATKLIDAAGVSVLKVSVNP